MKLLNWLAVTRNMSKDKPMTDLKNRRKEIEEIKQKMKRFVLNMDDTTRLIQKLKVKFLLQKYKIGEK